MEMAKITINGQAISAPFGSTILQAALQGKIDIPTLCNHPALRPAGSCRICVVEVKGQRVLQTACTFPITDGMEVQTESPRVVAARKLVIDLLFSERNHYCPFCEMSGNCELQALGYRYGLDHWVYPTYTRAFPLDASHKYLLMDHNRCVLCGRCMRGCSEIVANHTLGLRQRGARSMVSADMGMPWGDSTCIVCGTCAQLCPTGTLTDKRSAYAGRNIQMQYIETACSQCSIGCGMKIVTRNGAVQRIEGNWGAALNGGLLCQRGRFAPLFDRRERLRTPLLKRKGRQEPASWEEALQVVGERLSGTDGNLGVLATTNATNEALFMVGSLFRDHLQSKNIGLLNDLCPEWFGKPTGTFGDLLKSDLIVLAGADPAKDQPVASFLVKRSIDSGGRLIVVDGEENGLAPFAFLRLGINEIGQAVEIAERAENPVILYGAGLTKRAAESLKQVQGKALFIALEQGYNTRAAKDYGLKGSFSPSAAKVLYLLLGEQSWDSGDLFAQVGKETFVIVQSSFVSPLTRQADVVLPMAIWSERAGSLTNTVGAVLTTNRAIDPTGESKADWEILRLIADKLGINMGSSLSESTARETRK
ncbi:MAG: molybdopterin-dependent oxidoreductase [Deltaproteobacteria bacterium]|nr:molybdopterin-dependent oxidoreductase [Deltaproteobacteria bacterium]